jgi:hypothetical protein
VERFTIYRYHITLFETELSSLSSSLVRHILLEEGSSAVEEPSLSATETMLLLSKTEIEKLVAKNERQIYFLASSF